VTIFFRDPPRVLVQGITGREASMVVRHMQAYGAPVAAGVTPGRGGRRIENVPVFDTVKGAAEACGGPFDATLVSVPPLAVRDAAEESIDAGIGFLLIATENVPLHDAVRVLARAREAGATVVGPNSVGVIAPRSRLKLGAIGGDRPERAFVPGPVGVMSRSGGLTAEVGLQLRLRGLGVSTAVSIGGDAVIGTSPADLLRRFRADPETDLIVYVGEPGTRLEEELAEALAEDPAGAPLVAVVLGRFIEEFPEGTTFGHAAAVIDRGRGRPSDKMAALAEAGALVAESFDDVFDLAVDARSTAVSR
jgi:succinyl-CoA synthetase alpha subunit